MRKNTNFCKGSPIREQAAKICLERYGAPNWMQSDTGRAVLSKSVTDQWKRAKSVLESEELYSFEETKTLLESGDYWKTLQGKAKNRTLLKDNPRLYKSVYEYSKVLEEKMREAGRYASAYNFSHRLMFIVQHNGNIENLRCSCGRSYSWTGHCRHCSELKDTFSRLSADEQRERIQKQSLASRVQFGKKIREKGFRPNYDLEAVPIIDQLSKDFGWNLQHAENGGEVYVESTGCWLDGYDQKRNIVVEIDEPRHFQKGMLLERDQRRQKFLEDALGCAFYRIYFNKRTGSVILYYTPEHKNWRYKEGQQLSVEIGIKKNGTKTYSPYGISEKS